MEERINFISESYEIEGLIEKNDGDLGVVVTHPHPLYGGDMYNPVVETLVRVYRQKGFTTLRFNFRGAGNSQGHFDNGRGEQEDVCSAFEYLTAAGVKTIDLAGYSFGAWVNAYINPKEVNFENMIMVSPPVGFIEFTDVNSMPALKLVATGSRDDIAPPALIQKVLPSWNESARFEIVDGADHFYSGRLDQLSAALLLNL